MILSCGTEDIFKNWKGSTKESDLELISISSGPTKDIQEIILGTKKNQEVLRTQTNNEQSNNGMQAQNKQ